MSSFLKDEQCKPLCHLEVFLQNFQPFAAELGTTSIENPSIKFLTKLSVILLNCLA
jgi:hypothetical protein